MIQPRLDAENRCRFGVFEFDGQTLELSKNGRTVSLRLQPLKLLALLLARPGELVSRYELERALWGGDTFVDFEQGVNHAIRELRAALGDAAESPRFVQTLPRRGYRFIAPVELLPSARPQRSAQPAAAVDPAGAASPAAAPCDTSVVAHVGAGGRFAAVLAAVILVLLSTRAQRCGGRLSINRPLGAAVRRAVGSAARRWSRQRHLGPARRTASRVRAIRCARRGATHRSSGEWRSTATRSPCWRGCRMWRGA